MTKTKTEEKKETKKTISFEDLVLYILQNHSGGVKMTAFITDVVVLLNEKFVVDGLTGLIIVKSDDTSPFIEAIDTQLEQMQAAGTIGLLKYSWDMNGMRRFLDPGEEFEKAIREKVFIYTPLASTIFCCPPTTTCKCNCGTEESRVCEHKWDGEEEVIDNGSSVTCSKCGMSAMNHDMRCF